MLTQMAISYILCRKINFICTKPINRNLLCIVKYLHRNNQVFLSSSLIRSAISIHRRRFREVPVIKISRVGPRHILCEIMSRVRIPPDISCVYKDPRSSPRPHDSSRGRTRAKFGEQSAPDKKPKRRRQGNGRGGRVRGSDVTQK